ncbi:MAG: hypothetical protein AB1894_26030 [Chloroflexota bacterium]
MQAYEELLKALDGLSPVDGMTPIDVLNLPDDLGRLIGKLIRDGSMTLPQLASELHLQENQARKVGTLLTRKGFIYKDYHRGHGLIYRPQMVRMRKRNIPDF